jgi:predicted alpha-1,6-mannanase (GH76 family)
MIPLVGRPEGDGLDGEKASTMMRRLLGLVAAAAVVLGTAGGLAVTTPQSASALTRSQSDRAWTAFVHTYWDPSANYFFTNSGHQVDPAHNPGPDGGLYSDYWWEAQLWEGVEDRYQATHDPQARRMIEQVLAGFQAKYPDFRKNDYNDDMLWWARGSVRAYELTHDPKFLRESEAIFGYVSQFEDTTYGGGIWWKNVHVGDGTQNQKNVATNGTAIQTAAMLYRATGDPTYRATAIRLFTWLSANFDRDGRLRDDIDANGWHDYDFTYNQGGYAGAALQLSLITHDRTLIPKADRAVDWAVRYLTESGTFADEGTNDGSLFKAILTRNMRDLVDLAGQRQYAAVLTANASQAANHASPEGIVGPSWSLPTPSIRTTNVQSGAAGAGMAIQQQARPDRSTRIVTGDGVYEAENATRNGVGTTMTVAGYSGRAYADGPNADGQSIVFPVNVAHAGRTTVTVRYTAPAGDAVRSVTLNGHTVQFRLPATSGWRELRVPVSFRAGSQPITVAFDSAAGSTGSVAIDRIVVALRR